MQRIRETERGLQLTQEMGVVNFVPDKKGDVLILARKSALKDATNEKRYFTVEGRDNIRDFGEWLTRLSAEDSSEPTPSSFNTYTADQRTWVAAVSTVPENKGVGLGEFMDGNEDVGTRTIEDLSALIDVASEVLGLPARKLTRVENEAFAYPLGIPEGLSPILLATQTHDRLQLQFDELLLHGSMPLESAQQLGAWSIQGLADIQKKSIWT